MMRSIYNVADFWDYLGTAWHEFENKALIETFWSALASGVGYINTSLMDAQKSRSLEYMPATLNDGPEWYTITYSGVNANVYYPTPDIFHFELPSWTYEMPYLISGMDTVYYEGDDYTISGLNTLVWGRPWPSPTFGYSFKVKAPIVNRINPHLMSVYSKLIDLSLEEFDKYNTWGRDKYEHLKYFIWALVYKQTQPPTIKNLTDALGISKGAPFAYASGIMIPLSSTLIKVGDYTYTIPAGLQQLYSGMAVEQFDLLCSGIELYDYISAPDLVTDYAESKYNKRNTIVYSLSAAVKTLGHSDEFHSVYISGMFPCQYFYKEI